MKIGIIACGAVVRELIAIANRRGWDYELTAVPAQIHNRPERIAPEVEKVLDTWADRFDRILIGYGDCGSRGALDALLARYPHAVRIPGPHCYEFFGGPAFDEQAERQPGTFYLTDFLARHYKGLVIKGLGLDRLPELRDAYFGNYKELLYLRQLPEQDESQRAEEAAAHLGLAFRKVHVGLDILEDRLVELIENQEKPVSDHRTCPVCESPLTTDAIREGRCQCCGSDLPQEAAQDDE